MHSGGGDVAARSVQTRREKSCKPSLIPSLPVSRRMNLRSDYALVGGPRYGGVLQPAQQAQQAPDCDARVTALCKASSNALDSEGAQPPPNALCLPRLTRRARSGQHVRAAARGGGAALRLRGAVGARRRDARRDGDAGGGGGRAERGRQARGRGASGREGAWRDARKGRCTRATSRQRRATLTRGAPSRPSTKRRCRSTSCCWRASAGSRRRSAAWSARPARAAAGQQHARRAGQQHARRLRSHSASGLRAACALVLTC